MKRTWVVAFMAVMCASAWGAEKVTVDPVRYSNEYRFKATNDQFTFIFGTTHLEVKLAQLTSPDSTQLDFSADAIFVSAVDSLTVKPNSKPVRIFIEGTGTTLEEIITFVEPQRDTLKFELLKNYPMRAQSTLKEKREFSYAQLTDTNLVALRKSFDLDAVAGNGSEVERIIDLMHWVHTRIRHDGNTPNPLPNPRNAVNIIAVADRENWGMNCRMLATVLNECYLAMGFQSRHLTCLPFDINDQDCHVVNMVWSDSLRKWLYMDPTNDAYFTNTAGVILSPWEIRTAMAGGDSLVLPEEINWNGQRQNPVDYMNYMAKNLFRFECPQVSAYGYESWPGTRYYISLNPTDYDPGKQTSTKAESPAPGTSTLDEVVTDDPAVFFAAPRER
ncbi:MAG: hypothetical protein IT585_04585 [candidate division Zixibacteria bacterium]|nr:hypothetical protein [candidate division Zixibacteria bacterium]